MLETMVVPKIVDDLSLVEFAGAEDPNEPLLVYTIHDGAEVPHHLFGELDGALLSRPEVVHAYRTERDWGANLVARCLAAELGLRGFAKVNLARVVLDFGRFPGSSSHGVPYLFRKSIYPPLEGLLPSATQHELITRYYDGISQRITELFSTKSLIIGVHTCDAINHSGTMRPEVSLVTRSLEYQAESTIPEYLYDPLFPAELCEATCDRLLTYRSAFALEASGRHVAVNYPYLMPAGCVEIRAQVWFFFRYLRQRFTAVFPETRDVPAFQHIWQMLLDVTRRSGSAQALRGYLHRYREAPAGADALFTAARQAYGEIRRFLEHDDRQVVADYRFSADRPSSLGLEVRKDLLCVIDREHEGVEPHPEAEANARDIARHLAGAVRAHLGISAPSTESLIAEAAFQPQHIA